MNTVLPHGNKQHLILSTDSVQLNGKPRMVGRTGNNAGRRGAGGASQPLDLGGTICVPITLAIQIPLVMIRKYYQCTGARHDIPCSVL
jgi:hypothetical protein